MLVSALGNILGNICLAEACPHLTKLACPKACKSLNNLSDLVH